MRKSLWWLYLLSLCLALAGCIFGGAGKVTSYDWNHSDSDVFGKRSFLELMETPSSQIKQDMTKLGEYFRFFDYPDSHAATTKQYQYRMIPYIKRSTRPGSGINIGALDAPYEGAWGPKLEDDTFRIIQEAGFHIARLPVRFQAHLTATVPPVIDPTFLKRVDWALQTGLAQGLTVILDFHHFLNYDSLQNFKTKAEKDVTINQFKTIWSILADQYRDYPAALWFELLNEPHLPFSRDIWNTVANETLAMIRESGGANTTRTVLIGSATWSHVGALPYLKIPTVKEDPNIIVTFHYYEPFSFTHQGANWGPMRPLTEYWKGNVWTGTDYQKSLIENDFALAAQWAREQNRTLVLGEFGTRNEADKDSRVRYTRFVREQAEKHGIPWIYWCFDARDSLGIYDTRQSKWKGELLDVLNPIE